MELKLLPECDIYLKILREKPNPPINLLRETPDILPFSFPSIPQSDFQVFKKEIRKSQNPIEVVRKYNISFEFNENNLNIFTKEREYFDNYKEFVQQYVHYTFLGWCVKNQDNDALPPLSIFYSLAAICEPSDFAAFTGLCSISVSAFTFLYAQTFSGKRKKLGDYLSPLIVFLGHDRKLPSECYGLLTIATQSCSQQACTPESDSDFYEILTFAKSIPNLPQNVADSLLQSIVYQLSSLDLTALNLFNALLPKADKNSGQFMEIVTMSIVNYANQQSAIPIPEKSEAYQIDEKNLYNEGLFRFLKHDLFPNGIGFEKSIDFSDVKEVSSLIGSEFKKRLQLIIGAINDAPSFLEPLVANCISCGNYCEDQKTLLNLYSAFDYMLFMFESASHNPNLGKFLLNPLVFSPEITVFDKKENFENISILRSAALKLTSLYDYSSLDAFIMSIRKYPLLFSETIDRLLAISPGPFCEKILSRSVMQSALFYRPLATESSQVETALRSIFIYIYTVFQQLSVRTQCFSNMQFTQCFLAFIYEPKIRPFVLGELRNFLVNERNDEMQTRTSINLLISILDIACASISDDGAILLILDTLNEINEVLIHRWKLAKHFESLLYIFIKACSTLEDSPINRDFLDSVLSFITLLTNVHVMSAPELGSISSIIKTIYGKEPPKKVFYKLVQLSSSSIAASKSSSIIIKQPKVLRSVISLFSDTRYLIDVIKFIEGLCQYSYKNCVACHEGEIDLLLISLLKSGNCDNLSEEIFGVFNLISTVTSSVSVMQRYISLLCPVKNKISATHVNALKALTKNMYLSRRMPIASLPFVKDSYVSLHNVHTSILEEGWCFAIWLYNEPNDAQYKPQLISLIETSDKHITISSSSTQLVVCHNTDEYDTTATVDIEIPPRQWALVSMRYVPDEAKQASHFIASCNFSEPKKVNLPYLTWRKKIIQCTIGGMLPESIQVSYGSRFANFAFLTNITEEQLMAIYEAGPRIDPPSFDKTILYAHTMLKQNELAIETVESNYGVTMTYQYATKETLVSLSEVLGQMCKLEFLLPLYSHLDMIMLPPLPQEKYIDIVIDVFSNSLAMSLNAQKLFTEASGFDIVSHLLIVCDAQNITSQLYLHFYGLLEVISYARLQKQLLAAVLLNEMIWIRADAINHLKIIKHWARALYPSYPSLFAELKPLQKLLAILKIFYGNVPNSDSNLKAAADMRPQDLNTAECRRTILSIAQQMTISEFTNEDFLFLLGMIVTSQDYDLTIDLIKFLRYILELNPTPLKDVEVDAFSVLVITFSFNDPYIITQVLEMIYMAHKKNLFQQITLSDNIHIIMHEITYGIVRPEIFDSLMNLFMNGFYELLPFVSWMAINLGPRNIRKLVMSLKPSPEFSTHQTWQFWPVILLFKTPEDIKHLMFKFLIFSDMTCWENTFMMLDQVADLLGDDSSVYMHEFLMTICDYLSHANPVDHDRIQDFFTLAKAFIFFDNKNSALDTLFLFSPFSNYRRIRANSTIPRMSPERRRAISRLFNGQISPPPINIPGETNDLLRTPFSVENAMMHLNINASPGVFSLRIGPDGEWLDSELAKKCLGLFLLWNSPSFLDFDLTIAVFLIPYYYEYVKNHFIGLNLKAQDVASFTPLLALINAKCVDNSHPPLFRLNLKNEQFSAFQALKKFAGTPPQASLIHGSVVIQNQIIRFYKSIKTKAEAFLTISKYPQLSHTGTALKKTLYVMQRVRRDNEKKWIRLWRCMTIDGAPWASALPTPAESSVPLKRDNTSCQYSCPAKLKRDWVQPLTLLKFPSTSQVFFKPQEKTSAPKDDAGEIACNICTVNNVTSAFMILGNNSILVKKESGSFQEWSYSSMKSVLLRNRIHQNKALEFFFKSGKTKLVSFDEKGYTKVFNAVKSKKLITLPQAVLPELTKKWANEKISNFEYIMTLNMLSGRTFNDITQYPIMPWVITDFESKDIKLKDSLFVRDIRKPMSQLGQERLMRIISKMQETSVENFSLPGSVLRPKDVESLLCRLNPFSEMEGAKNPTMSMKDAFIKATTDDECFSELIPEFFYMPEAFIQTRTDNTIKPMQMAQWAEDPYTFVYINRKALESEYVSQFINQWIDIIWGVKQNGNGAISAFNKFDNSVYEDAENSEDYKKNELVTGLMPLQLFTELHPPRLKEELSVADLKKVPEIGSSLIKKPTIAKEEKDERPQLIIQTQSDEILYSDFFKVGKIINVLNVTVDGNVTTYVIDFDKLQKYTTTTAMKERFISELPENEAKSQLFRDTAKFSPMRRADRRMSCWDNYNEDELSASYNYQQSQGIVSSYSTERINQLSKSSYTPTGSPKGKLSSKNIAPPSTTVQIPGFSSIQITGKSGQFQLISPYVLAYIDNGDVTFFNTQTKHVSHMKSHLSDVVTLSSNKEWIATVSKGSVLTLYKSNDYNKYVYSIPLYRDSIQCTYVSTHFNLAVAGTRDGFLFLISLTRGTAGSAVDLKGARPYRVLITPSWGFIVVYMTQLDRGLVRHVLALYSPNGNLIRKRTIAHAITAWSCFHTHDGFDYVACADDRGRIWLFEAFSLMLDESIYRCNSQVLAVMYSTEHEGVIATTEDRKIIFIPALLSKLSNQNE